MRTVTDSIEWVVASRPMPDQPVSGDAHIVTMLGHDILLGVADGLGHGPQAALASATAMAALERTRARDVAAAMRDCHESLRGTRGVALSLVAIQPPLDRMTWVGVGNVEAVLFRSAPVNAPVRERITSRPGIVGHRLPTLRPQSVQIPPDSILLFATDGIETRFAEYVPGPGSLSTIADDVLRTYSRPNDDALVLAVRYRGYSHG